MSVLQLGLVKRNCCVLLGNSCATLERLLSTERLSSVSSTKPGVELEPIQLEDHEALLEQVKEMLAEVHVRGMWKSC